MSSFLEMVLAPSHGWTPCSCKLLCCSTRLRPDRCPVLLQPEKLRSPTNSNTDQVWGLRHTWTTSTTLRMFKNHEARAMQVTPKSTGLHQLICWKSYTSHTFTNANKSEYDTLKEQPNGMIFISFPNIFDPFPSSPN